MGHSCNPEVTPCAHLSQSHRRGCQETGVSSANAAAHSPRSGCAEEPRYRTRLLFRGHPFPGGPRDRDRAPQSHPLILRLLRPAGVLVLTTTPAACAVPVAAATMATCTAIATCAALLLTAGDEFKPPFVDVKQTRGAGGLQLRGGYVLLNHRVFIPIQNCFMPHGNHQWANAAGNYAYKCA